MVTIKLLIVAPYPIVPATAGGKIRVVELAWLLARRDFAVTVLTPYKPQQRSSYDPSCGFALRQLVYPFVLPLALTDRPFPYGHVVSYHPGCGLLLRRLFAQFDIIQFEQGYWGGMARDVAPDKIVVYDAHNVEYDYLTSECRGERVQRIVGRRAHKVEKSLYRRADLTVCCTDLDADRLAELYGAPRGERLIAPNGIPAPATASSRGSMESLLKRMPRLAEYSRLAVFSGSDVEHNRVAVRWIFDDLAPRLGEGWGVIIHGGAGKRFQKTEAPPNIFLDSDWSGFSHYAGTGVVGLNPITPGSGMNLKLLNYLAHRLATVSTPFGLRGCEKMASMVTLRPMEEFAAGMEVAMPPGEQLEEMLQGYLWTTIADQVAERLHALPAR